MANHVTWNNSIAISLASPQSAQIDLIVSVVRCMMSKTEEESEEIHSFTDARLYTHATSGFYGAFFAVD